MEENFELHGGLGVVRGGDVEAKSSGKGPYQFLSASHLSRVSTAHWPSSVSDVRGEEEVIPS